MSSELHDVSLEGNLHSLHNLFQQDPHILDRCINRKQWSPLHIASSKGNLDIVTKLLQEKPNLCFTRDRDGRNPVHIAAIEGHLNVLQHFKTNNLHAIRERTNSGETVLHLCVKHNHINALGDFLKLEDVELLNSKDINGNTILHLAVAGNQKEDFLTLEEVELLNSKDINGITILHLAVAGKQTQMIKLILAESRIDKNAVNNYGLTALDSHIGSQLEKEKGDIWNSLKKNGALRAKDLHLKIKDNTWVENQSQALMVVASLIAAMAFQVVLYPPRGFWQDGKLSGPNANTMDMDRTEKFFSFHNAGAPIARDLVPRLYHQLIIWNTIALASSLGVIFLLISGFAYGRRFVEILRVTMWISVTATFATYIVSLAVINWHHEHKHNPLYEPSLGPSPPPMSNSRMSKFGLSVWIIVLPILLVVLPLVLFLAKFIKNRHWFLSRST